MVGPQRLGEQVVHDVLGRVLVHVDLLEDHLALGLKVRGAKERVLLHVGEMLHRHRQVTIEHACVKARVLLGREGVHVAADRVEGLGDVARGPRRRSP